jgi:hypothetical protein
MKTNTALLLAILIIIGVGAVIFSGDGFSGNQSDTQSQSTSVISVDRILHDFGEIDIFGGNVITEFMLTNEGPDDVYITGGTTSCGCTEAEIGGIGFGMHENMRESFMIPTGETKPLTVIYDPLAHGLSGVGLAQRVVYLETDSSETPNIEIRIKALVTNNN